MLTEILTSMRLSCRYFVKAGCLLMICLWLTGCNEQIVHNLNEQDANRLITRLADASIDSSKIKQPDGLWAIAVARGDTLEALRFLDGARLFKGAPATAEEGSTLMSSREDQLFRFERALSREIEETLSSIDGVLQARVHLNLPPTDPLFGQPLIKDQKGSASVLLITNQKFELDKEAVAALVAGASGLERTKVAVLVGGSSEAAISHAPEKPAVTQVTPPLAATTREESSFWQGVFGWLFGNQLLLLEVGFGFGACGLLALAWLFFSRRRVSY